jgi:hypothetical protein
MRTCHEDTEREQMYSSTISLTSAIYGDGWLTSRSGRFTPRNDPGPIVQEAGWAQGIICRGVENLANILTENYIDTFYNRPSYPYKRNI